MNWSTTASRRVPLPSAAAWAVISDLSRTHEWLPCHGEWRTPPARPRRGLPLTEQVLIFGADHLIRWTITEWTPPSAFQFSAAVPELLTFSYGAHIQPIDATSSDIALRVVLHGPILRQFRTNQLRSATRANMDRAVTKLEELLSNTAGHPHRRWRSAESPRRSSTFHRDSMPLASPATPTPARTVEP
ncbi:SRPBCC family protein [Nocardia huaxiensis]|uniref:SRPBCC family protein n=1 Tax=Nocardia huaxiensis TaxID=2755382 RepID=UPI001E2E822C|nr:SRPBCC family protein [Nocardia huaxiensis]UFS98424.1 SRPBCC family protein [Nocardia huaxiensis]